MSGARVEVGPRPGRAIANASVVEWDEPIGGGGTTNAISVLVNNDPAGQIWIRVSMGDEVAFIRPGNLRDFAFELVSKSRWVDCYWDLELDACVSRTCQFKPGNSHIGRLRPWEAMRNRRVTGTDRDPEILRLFDAGLSRGKIALRVGWSISTVSRVIRDNRGSRAIA